MATIKNRVLTHVSPSFFMNVKPLLFTLKPTNETDEKKWSRGCLPFFPFADVNIKESVNLGNVSAAFLTCQQKEDCYRS